jgi:hypothetical protein
MRYGHGPGTTRKSHGDSSSPGSVRILSLVPAGLQSGERAFAEGRRRAFAVSWRARDRGLGSLKATTRGASVSKEQGMERTSQRWQRAM